MNAKELSISASKEKLQENKDNKMDYKCKKCQKIISDPVKSFESFYFCEECFSKIKSNNAAPNIRSQDDNINLKDNAEEIKVQAQSIQNNPNNSVLKENNNIQKPSENDNNLQESFITPKEEEILANESINNSNNLEKKISNENENNINIKPNNNNENNIHLKKNGNNINENNIGQERNDNKNESKINQEKIGNNNNENNINQERNGNNNENNINQERNGNNNNEIKNINLLDYINAKTSILIIILAAFILIIAIFMKNRAGNTFDSDEFEVFDEKDIKMENKEINLNKPIIGIDFGSSYSGFSFGIDTETIETKYENIEPTIIVIEKETKKGYKYGNEADNFMSNGRNSNYIYFDRIKTRLDPKFANNDQSEIYIEASFPKNYKMQLKLVIKEYLRLFSDNILKYVNLKGKSYSKDDLKWIITVPAIWNDYGKQLMIECSREAGMNDISIALEPEAASLTMFNDKFIEKYLKEKGKKFMLIDAGGYTIDITLNEIINNYGYLKQLSPPSGGSYGSMNINKELINLVEEIFGKEKIDNLKENRFDLWKITLDSIEKKKKEIKNDVSDAKYFKIDTRFEEKVCSSNYKCEKKTSYGNVNFTNNYIEVPREVMKYIILKNINPIINHIKNLFKKFKNISIDMLILTGGFSNCKLLIDEINKNFKNCPHRTLSMPETSVMNGAVLYGIDQNKIVSRKAPYTIGISTYSYYEPGTECKEKIVIDSNIYCRYFDIFKRKGDDINNNESIIKSYIPLYSIQTSVRFILYYSTSFNPIYIDQENVKKIAEFSLEMKETDKKLEEREAICEMVFGSCITVQAKNVLSGKEVKITANYYNRND